MHYIMKKLLQWNIIKVWAIFNKNIGLEIDKTEVKKPHSNSEVTLTLIVRLRHAL